MSLLDAGRINLPRDVLVPSGAVSSLSEARRLIKQGGVRVDGQKLGVDESDLIPVDGMIIRAGKRTFIRLKVE
jgi:tyrosyl-tRNA synthetase